MLRKCSIQECLYILEFVYIVQVSGEALAEKLLNIFDKISCSFSPEHIESCHRIRKTTDTVIVKFSWRKNFQQDWKVKNDMQKLKINFNLLGSNKCFIHKKTSSKYKVLWSKSKKLHSLGKSCSFIEAIKIKSSKNSLPLWVTPMTTSESIFQMLICHHTHFFVK